VTRTLCGFMLLFAIACSKSPTAPTSVEPPTQSGPPVIDLQWNVAASSCGPVTPSPVQPSLTTATSVQQTDTTLNAAWPYQSGARTGVLYARFVRENNAWALCTWDIADV
jgi:hypothetical protein